MSTWPFSHDWSSSYTVTYSFKTEILTSRSGVEQRRAVRYEPRRTVETTTGEWRDDARALDAFIWSTQAQPFTYPDPLTGAQSLVRLPDTVALAYLTSAVSTLSVTFDVVPGSDRFVRPVPDAANTYAGRYVFAPELEWSNPVSSSEFFPRQIVDFDAGVTAVTRPIAFGTRTNNVGVVHDNPIATQTVVDFFLWARGRQYDFWLSSPLDDLRLLETVSGIRLAGFQSAVLDTVNVGLQFELVSGGVYRRFITALAPDGTVTLDSDIPDNVTPATVRRLTWLRIGRFASDDLSVEWFKSTAARSQVQTLTLPYRAPNGSLFDPDTAALLDYYGNGFFGGLFADPLDFIVNVQVPRLGGYLTYRDDFDDPLQYIVNVQIPEIN